MKHHLLLRGLFCLSSLTTLQAQDPLTLEANQFLFSSGDFNNDARRDGVIVDRTNGSIRLFTQLANGSLSWGEAQPSGIESPEALAVGRFYLSTHDAIAVGSTTANRIHLFGLTNPAEVFSPQVIFPSAPGPSSLAAIDVDQTGGADLVSIVEGVSPRLNKGRARTYEALTTLTSTPSTPWTYNYASLTERINPVRPKTGATPRLAEIYFAQGSSTASFYLETVGPTGLSSAIFISPIPSDSRYAVGSLDATTLNHFLFWSPGLSILRCARINESTPLSFTFGSLQSFTLNGNGGIQQVVPVQSGAAARIAVLFGDGTTRIYDFNGTAAPTLRSTHLDAPGDLILPLENNSFLVASGLRTAQPSWRRYSPSANTYQITASGEIPAFRPAAQYSNILFLSAEPFANESVTPRLLTHFREWTTSASFSSGIAWNIQSLAYNNTTSGLSGAQSVTLSGTTASDFPLVNQYSPSLSIYSLESRTGDLLGDIVFDPPPGTYSPPPAFPTSNPPLPANPNPEPVVSVRISPTQPGFTLYYRTSPSGDFTTVPSSGIIPLSSSTTFQVYGTRPGERTPLRSATYTITSPSLLSSPTPIDADQDGLPDAWEAAFQAYDPTADPDGDGYSNAEEASAGGDPSLFAYLPNLPPKLTGTRISTHTFRLEWPAADTFSSLQYSTNLQTWQNYPSSPSIVGNRFRIDAPIQPLTQQKYFFRLQRP